jgi:hypothetical protein
LGEKSGFVRIYAGWKMEDGEERKERDDEGEE